MRGTDKSVCATCVCGTDKSVCATCVCGTDTPVCAAAGKAPLAISSPPEFKGDRGFWMPEDFFVGAVETCLLMTFAHQVERQGLPVEAHYSEAEGLLETLLTIVTVVPEIQLSVIE